MSKPQVIVDFCDPNATKALHVGHLRNIAVGHALASLHEYMAVVERQTHIGDAGRQMGEAMAGWVRFARYGEASLPFRTMTPRPDRYIGALAANYASEVVIPEVPEGDGPIARDLAELNDEAEAWLRKCSDGVPHAVRLATTITDSVVYAQRRTLDRLGVRFDRTLYDSKGVARARALATRGCELGVFVAEAEGTIAYYTGEEGYPVMPLTRKDGTPTHHLRVAAMWLDAMLKNPSVTLIHVAGEEWEAHTRHMERLLERLEPTLAPKPDRYVLHGMVVWPGGAKISSSEGDPPLIDDLLDGLTVTLSGGAARMLLLGTCLARITRRTLELDERKLMSDRNPAWRVVRVWGDLQQAEGDGVPLPSAMHHEVRAVCMNARHAMDPHPAMRWLVALADAHLAGKTGDPAVVRWAMGEVLRRLGLIEEGDQE